MQEETRDFHIVVLGASGFTGKFVVDRLVQVEATTTTTTKLRWAVAGRSEQRLRNALRECGAAKQSDEMILLADVFDAASLDAVCRRARVIINCVGPFRLYGEPVIRACIEHSCDYVDITGEPEFIERMMLTYHERAQRQNSTVVSACGFDSLPTDMSVLRIKRTLHQKGVQPSAIEMFVEVHAGPSGVTAHYGTYETVVRSAGSIRALRGLRKKAARPRIPRVGPVVKMNYWPHYEERVRAYVFPFLFADPSVVRLSQQLVLQGQGAMDLPPPPPVQFNAYVAVRSLWVFLGMAVWFVAFSVVSQFEAGRRLLLKYPKQLTFGLFTHEGPTAQQLQETFFTSTFFIQGYRSSGKEGEAVQQQPAPRQQPDYRAVMHVHGPELGYLTTSACVVEAALTLVEQKKSKGIPAGVLTPAVAFAKTDLMERLERSVLTVEWKEQP